MVCNQSLEMHEDQGMAAMLDDKIKGSVIQHGCHTIVFWISRDWLQTTYSHREHTITFGTSYPSCAKKGRCIVQTLVVALVLDSHLCQCSAIQVLTGNRDRNTIVRHRFARPLRARYIRVVPVLWHSHISMRVEIYGRRLGEWNFISCVRLAYEPAYCSQ